MTQSEKLIDLFRAYARERNHHDALTALVDHFITVFSTTTTRPATSDDQSRLVPLLYAIGEHAEGFRDPFGEIYMELVSKGRNGQFFTPEPVGGLIAAITLTGSTDNRVLDPACGSGRLLLAAAKIDRSVRLYGVDVDQTCCKMAVANLLLQSLTGEIAHMDSLSGQFFRGYRVGTAIRNGFHYPQVTEFTDKSESLVWKAGGYGGEGER